MHKGNFTIAFLSFFFSLFALTTVVLFFILSRQYSKYIGGKHNYLVLEYSANYSL